ncbi:MAG: adenylate/guanylate cyclase domain-containing protein [Pseudomonadota bacterium]
MTIEAINEHLLRAIGVGVALLDPTKLTLRFQNAVFWEWYSAPEIGSPITAVLPDLDIAAVQSGLEAEGRYQLETSVRRKRRTLVMALVFTRTSEDLVLLECQNITRIRELESMIESYSAMVERNTRDLEREKERVEKLLLTIMPRQVYEEYKTFGVVVPQSYEPVAILTLDFLDFGERVRTVNPSMLISEMNDIQQAFDRIGEQFGCERIKTLGDTYVSVCGLTDPGEENAVAAAHAAIRFVRYLSRRNQNHPQTWSCRIGIACGLVIGSVVGAQRYVYDVFGPAVQASARLCDRAEAMEILADPALAPTLSATFGTEPTAGTGTDLRVIGALDEPA